MGDFLNLKKGNFLDLSKSLEKIKISLNWDSSNTNEQADLDLSLIIFRNNELVGPQDVMYYNNKGSVNGITKSGDNRQGGNEEEDDEKAIIILSELDSNINKILIVASVFSKIGDDGQIVGKPKTFITVKNAKVSLEDNENNEKLCEYVLTDDFSSATIVEFALLEKRNNGWQFKALGNGYTNNLSVLAEKYYEKIMKI